MNQIIKSIRMTLCTWTACMMLVVSGGLLSCDYLSIESYTDNELALDSIFTQARYIEAFMWGATDKFPDEGALCLRNPSNIYTPGPMATDEAFTLQVTSDFHGMGFVLGERNESNLGDLDQWNNLYQVVRQCNTIFTRMDEAKDWTTSERLRITATTRFFRAYAYYLLLMNHGPVVLLGDEVVKNNEHITYYDRPRDLYDDCVEYICTELEEAARFMRPRVESIAEFGRPTKGAALGLVAKLRLQHASDLYNGGSSARMFFASWRRETDGAHYIQQNYDPERWAVAAAAAKRLIDLKDDVGRKMYELHVVPADMNTPPLNPDTEDENYLDEWPNGAGGIDPYHSYIDMFNGESVMSSIEEFVWARRSDAVRQLTQRSFPQTYGGQNSLCVPQKIVDAYEMRDGYPKENSSTFAPYEETGFTDETKVDLYTDFRLLAETSRMYENREPRFYASIGFTNSWWSMLSTTNTEMKEKSVSYYADDPNGKNVVTNVNQYPITGYVIRKFIHPMDAWAGTSNRRLNKPYAMIRYAEILLAYAEALNHLDKSYEIEVDGVTQTFSRDEEQIKWAFNQIRYRAGLPGLTYVPNVNEMMQKIKRERMIEFLHEGQRYFDVRRWGDYFESENETITGMNTAGNKDSYYQRVIPAHPRMSQRIIDRKMIFVPIPLQEIRRLPSFDQNPGW